MDSALVVGGTRFIGRHLVEELLGYDYDVTLFNRGRHDDPFADEERVARVTGDRTDESDLREAATAVAPEAVFDCVAYHPDEVETALDVFADAEAYVYVSSAAAYGVDEIPKREGETPLRECTPSQATDDSMATYGNRKAEGDRAVFAAARTAGSEAGGAGGETADGRNARAMSVRPTVVYGPHDYTERLDYWLDRIDSYDRIVVPGDGDSLSHLAYVEDVASALRVVAERGDDGEAYNVGDRRLVTLGELIEGIADAMDRGVEAVTACERELGVADLSPGDFSLYREYPYVLDTDKLAALGWESTPVAEALARTAAEHRESARDGREHGPDREDEERVLAVLDTL